ncbi:MAG: hypothetical protein SNJ59_04585 [Aggregatilineales bacterium]
MRLDAVNDGALDRRDPFYALTPPGVDQNLPEWARRSNPIVRRHLGGYFKAMPLELGGLGRIIGLQFAFILLTLPLPFLLTILMPVATASLVVLPAALFQYGRSLLTIGLSASAAVALERANQSLDLLRVSPRPLDQILLSKIAAAIWREIENLALIMVAVAVFSLPLLVIQYDALLSAQDQPLFMRFGLMVALLISLLRIPFEVTMIAAIGGLMGALGRVRAAAFIATALCGAAYFAFINLLRLLTLDVSARLFVEMALPLLLPAAITALCLRLSLVILTRES